MKYRLYDDCDVKGRHKFCFLLTEASKYHEIGSVSDLLFFHVMQKFQIEQWGECSRMVILYSNIVTTLVIQWNLS